MTQTPIRKKPGNYTRAMAALKRIVTLYHGVDYFSLTPREREIAILLKRLSLLRQNASGTLTRWQKKR